MNSRITFTNCEASDGFGDGIIIDGVAVTMKNFKSVNNKRNGYVFQNDASVDAVDCKAEANHGAGFLVKSEE